jgi:hypothetical protein
MVNTWIKKLLWVGLVLTFPASAMEFLLSATPGETVIVSLQEKNTFKLAHSRPLDAKTSVEFESKPRVLTGWFEKKGEHIVLWDDARELGRIRLWDPTGKIQANLFLSDAKNAQVFWGLLFR